MKKILTRPKKTTWKDWARIFAVTFLYYLAFYTYAGLLVGLYVLINGDISIPLTEWRNGWFIYLALVSPFLAGALHILYSEYGLPWFRLLTWVHILINFIMVPFFIFFFI